LAPSKPYVFERRDLVSSPGTDPHWSNVELKLHMLFPSFFSIDKTRTIRITPICAKSLAAFDVNKLLRMTEFYPNDFIDVPEVALRTQLKNYVTNFDLTQKLLSCKGFQIFVQNLWKQINATHLLWFINF